MLDGNNGGDGVKSSVIQVKFYQNVYHNNNKMLLSDIDKVNRLCLLLLLIQSALYPDVTHISLYAPRRDAISLIFVAMRVSKH